MNDFICVLLFLFGCASPWFAFAAWVWLSNKQEDRAVQDILANRERQRRNRPEAQAFAEWARQE